MDQNHSPEYTKALEYHQQDKPGKLAIKPTKPLGTQQELALAYSPGVAAPCLEIKKNPEDIYKYTAKGNTVAVITNGTAVLGLGAIGAAASKPVMEGKAVLFKKFADIDAIDLEVDITDTQQFIDTIKHLGASWGGINLEDIKAPECFTIEEELKKAMDIPVFHDDQHGTAIITAAGLINAVHLTQRKMNNLNIVVNGAGAAAISCINLLIELGADPSKIILCDTKGVIYKGRTERMNQWKEAKAVDTQCRTLAEAIVDADVFLGLSAKGAVTKEMVASMAASPIIFAMANPDPEILPEDIKEVRQDAIIATGRSDYNNQINNVMGFPYIFRGALDVRATSINSEMKIAAAKALADLARKPVPRQVYKAYGTSHKTFGPEYIIPVPFDPRLITTIPLAVAKAAIETGVAKIDKLNVPQYIAALASRLNPTSNYMHFIYERIKNAPLQRIILAEGEEEEVIKAARMMCDEHYAIPIIVGRIDKIKAVAASMGNYSLEGITLMNAAVNDKLTQYIDALYARLQRKGYLYRDCARMVKTDRNVFAACMIACGDADGMVTGVTRSYYNSLDDICKVIEPKKNQRILGYSIMLSEKHNLIIADNTVCEFPDAKDIAEIAAQTAKAVKLIGLKPRVAIISFSNFGNPAREKTARVRDAMHLLDSMKPDFEYDGEMSVEVALNPNLQKSLYPFCKLTGPANILIMPGLHSASIATQLLEQVSGGTFIGPILNGFEYPVQIAYTGSAADDILHAAAFAIIEALNNSS